jgi:hypothetical protein
MPRELSNVSDIATEHENIAGRESAILTIQPKDGRAVVINGMVDNGESKGFPVFAKLVAQDGEPMPLETNLAWQFESPGDDDPTTVTFPLTNIRAYRTLSIEDQQNNENIDAVKHVIKGTDAALAEGTMPQIAVGHLDELSLVAESEKVIDWDHPDTRVYIGRHAVTEV